MHVCVFLYFYSSWNQLRVRPGEKEFVLHFYIKPVQGIYFGVGKITHLHFILKTFPQLRCRSGGVVSHFLPFVHERQDLCVNLSNGRILNLTDRNQSQYVSVLHVVLPLGHRCSLPSCQCLPKSFSLGCSHTTLYTCVTFEEEAQEAQEEQEQEETRSLVGMMSQTNLYSFLELPKDTTFLEEYLEDHASYSWVSRSHRHITLFW